MSKDEEYKEFVDEFISLLEDDPKMFPAFTDFFDNEVLTDCGITLADFERGLALNFNGGSKTYFEIYWRD
ncbi:MAG: hypothetical protein E7312_00225 [Clostridiales bacterium]|nr:hypothetical protein [Clostridiales bacterium]